MLAGAVRIWATRRAKPSTRWQSSDSHESSFSARYSRCSCHRAEGVGQLLETDTLSVGR